MDFKSIAEVLNFAISKERASEQFYIDLAAEMKDAATQSVFQVIAKQEHAHAESLELEMMKAGYTLRDESIRVSETEFEWAESLEVDEEAQNMNYADGLLLAIQKERAAFQLYAQLVGVVDNLEFRRLLLDLAEEEMRHVLQFEREYETIAHHKD